MAGIKLEDLSAKDLTSVLYSMCLDDMGGRLQAREKLDEVLFPAPDPFVNANPATWGLDPEAIAAAERAKVI